MKPTVAWEDGGALSASYRARWHGDDFAVFSYTPARYLRYRDNPASPLVWAFKDEDREAMRVAVEWSLRTLPKLEPRLRAAGCRTVVAVPRSTAGKPNVGCEAIAAALAEGLGIAHLPHALVRTESVPPSHLGERVSADRHFETIVFTGSAGPSVAGLYCRVCDKHFRTPGGLDWHIANNAAHARRAATDGAGNVLIVDDLFTHGATSAAVRRVFRERHGVERVLGFFLARTG